MAKQVDATYGNALFELEVEENKVDALYDEAGILLKVLDSNPELLKLLSHPHVSKEDKVKVVKGTFEGRTDDEITGLLVMIVEKGHAKDIPAIIRYFLAKVKSYKKIGVVDVTSASELSDSQKKAVEKRILETTDYKSLEVNYQKDKDIIGGLIIRIEDRVVDSSVRTKLNTMAKALA
jgi:F-type H+-transporting ATPase subunit delta